MTFTEGQPMNIFDKLNAFIRQEIIMDMAQNKQIDAEEFTALYQAVVRADQVVKSREAFLANDSGPDTPVGKLSTLWCKLKVTRK